MARINLLPWREALRKEKQKEFLSQVGLMAILMVAIIGYVHIHYNNQIDSQESRNSFLVKEIKVMDGMIKEINELEKNKQNLLARMDVIQTLQASRSGIVILFDELVGSVPEGVYLTSLSKKGNMVYIDGRAQSNSRVSSFMRQLDESKWFDNPQLVVIDSELKKEDVSGGNRFSLKVKQVEIVSDKNKEDKEAQSS